VSRDYSIAALEKALTVLDVLEGSADKPVTLKEIARRSKQNANFCFRALKTFEAKNYVRETEHGWSITAKLLRFSERYEEFLEKV
jgi:Transcriptional regulator